MYSFPLWPTTSWIPHHDHIMSDLGSFCEIVHTGGGHVIDCTPLLLISVAMSSGFLSFCSNLPRKRMIFWVGSRSTSLMAWLRMSRIKDQWIKPSSWHTRGKVFFFFYRGGFEFLFLSLHNIENAVRYRARKKSPCFRNKNIATVKNLQNLDRNTTGMFGACKWRFLE